MLGNELPSENASDTKKNPNAAVMLMSRTIPVTREVTVPTAITELGPINIRSDMWTILLCIQACAGSRLVNSPGNAYNNEKHHGNEGGSDHPACSTGVCG